MTAPELVVRTLGERRFDSPLGGGRRLFVADTTRVLLEDEFEEGGAAPRTDRSLERAGPRSRIFFDPASTCVALVTCGGLSPGLNNVIRGAFYELRHHYRIPRMRGTR